MWRGIYNRKYSKNRISIPGEMKMITNMSNFQKILNQWFKSNLEYFFNICYQRSLDNTCTTNYL